MHSAAARYRQVQASTSSPGELLIALYDGLFRFLNGAQTFLERGERARAAELLSKAYAVVSELYIALDHAAYPELCANLEGIYGFCMDRIMHANTSGAKESVSEVIRVLEPLRDAWKQAVPMALMEQARGTR